MKTIISIEKKERKENTNKKKTTAIVFNYSYTNRISYNVLSDALLTNCKHIEIYFEKNNPLDVFKQITKEHKNVIFAISMITTQQKELYDLMKKTKDLYPDIIIIAGGPHSTALPKEVLENGADFVVIGEGEKTFPELVNVLNNSLTNSSKNSLKIKNNDFKKVKGIAYLDKKYIKKTNTKKEEIKLIKTPLQDLINLDDYAPVAEKLKFYNTIEITRGCIFACNFCCVTRQTRGKLRYRSIDNILKYMQQMCDKDLPDVRFITSNAFGYGSIDGRTINYEAIEELLSKTKKLITPYGGKFFFGTFPSEVRPEHVNDKTLGLVKKYCDNDSIIIGAQSGSNRILKLCNRGHTIEDIYTATDIITMHGLKPNIDFIFGLPFETKDDQLKTLSAIKRLVKMGARIHAHFFLPLPGTVFANKEHTKLDSNIEKEYEKLARCGHLYGDWKKQKEFVSKSNDF